MRRKQLWQSSRLFLCHGPKKTIMLVHEHEFLEMLRLTRSMQFWKPGQINFKRNLKFFCSKSKNSLRKFIKSEMSFLFLTVSLDTLNPVLTALPKSFWSKSKKCNQKPRKYIILKYFKNYSALKKFLWWKCRRHLWQSGWTSFEFVLHSAQKTIDFQTCFIQCYSQKLSLWKLSAVLTARTKYFWQETIMFLLKVHIYKAQNQKD